MRNGAITWRDHDRARNASKLRISQAPEADLSGPLPMSALGISLIGRRLSNARFALLSGQRFAYRAAVSRDPRQSKLLGGLPSFTNTIPWASAHLRSSPALSKREQVCALFRAVISTDAN